MKPRCLELLAPARNADIAIQAIDHGADAVYMGPPRFGARQAAANTIDDFRRVAEHAHRYGVRVYATVNTVLFDSELSAAERLIADLYRAGVDAIIVQDMAILRLDIPPIELHASTQCDIRTPEKARFLQDVGFSQLVLARELTIPEIETIASAVTVPVECFVHGALCVSYSGRCHASAVCKGRSANRGECAQMCRLPYTLRDADGRVLIRDRHLLSLRDLNASASLADMAAAGVRSFKIEGRLKDASYVKNITAHYRRLLDSLIDASDGAYTRASSGRVTTTFTPAPSKSFNRGFTDYFLSSRSPRSLAQPLTPKSLGEVVKVEDLHNADGVAFFDRDGQYVGFNVNKVEHGRIIPNRPVRIPNGVTLHRTADRQFETLLARSSARREIPFSVSIDAAGVSARDSRGMYVRIPNDAPTDLAVKPLNPDALFARTGHTIYTLENCTNLLDPSVFIPASALTRLKNSLLHALDVAAESTYRRPLRRAEDRESRYPTDSLDFRDNVSNRLARDFYRSHGVTSIEPAVESDSAHTHHTGIVLMTCRHCILRDTGRCKKEKGSATVREPLYLTSSEGTRLQLRFDCRRCEMQVLLCND